MPNGPKKYLISIVGPTAVGKTALAIEVARNINTDIVSADSRQIFKELTIGTAKPSADELAAVRHHFVNSHSICDAYSAGDFERDALSLLETLFIDHDYVVMAGGSGFYVKAVLEGLDSLPGPLPGLRAALSARLHTEGMAVLQEEVRKLDPVFAITAAFKNPQRVIRALEVYHTSGLPISSYQSKMNKKRPFENILIGLDRDRSELYSRIDRRMDQMLSDGLVEEVRGLWEYRGHNALQTVGYREVFDYIDGKYNAEEMSRLLKQNSRRYAKRQLTWFKNQGNFEWFHPNDIQGIMKCVYDR